MDAILLLARGRQLVEGGPRSFPNKNRDPSGGRRVNWEGNNLIDCDRMQALPYLRRLSRSRSRLSLFRDARQRKAGSEKNGGGAREALRLTVTPAGAVRFVVATRAEKTKR